MNASELFPNTVKKQLLKAFKEKLQATTMASQRNMPFVDWITTRWRVHNNRTWQPFTFDLHEFQKQWIERFMKDRYTVWCKAAQMGITEIHLAGAFYLADVWSGSSMYIYPTDELAFLFSRSRAKESTSQNSYLYENLKETDSREIKKFKNALLYFRGAWSKRKLKSIPTDQVILDEFDDLPAGMADLARDRVDHSDLKIIRIFSTPELPGFGVDFEFSKTNQCYFIPKCLSCSLDVCIEDYFPQILIPKKETYYLGCPKCHTPIDLSTCRWVEKYPSLRDRVGYHITQLHKPDLDVTSFTKSYQDAVQKGGVHLRNFMNSKMGLAYGGEAQPLTEDILRKACTNDPLKWGGVSSYDQTFMGIDQGDLLHVVVLEKLPGSKLRVIWLEETSDFERLDVLMEVFDIKFAVIDDKPNRHPAKAFVLKHEGRAAWCQFTRIEELREDEKEGIARVLAPRDVVLEDYCALYTKDQIILPKPSEPSMDTFFRHHQKLLIETVDDPVTGKKRKQFKKGVENHYGLAGCYAYIASLIKSNRIITFKTRTGDYRSITSNYIETFKTEYNHIL